MRTSIRRQLLTATLLLAAGAAAIPASGHVSRDTRYGIGGAGSPFLPNIKAHTVQEKVLLLKLLHGPFADPSAIYHSVQETPVPAPKQTPKSVNRARYGS